MFNNFNDFKTIKRLGNEPLSVAVKVICCNVSEKCCSVNVDKI